VSTPRGARLSICSAFSYSAWMKLQLVQLAVVAFCTAACTSSNSTPAAEAKASANADASVKAPANTDAGVKSSVNADAGVTAPTNTMPKPAAALVFTPQAGWVVEQPASAMRKAQYRLPHVDADAEDASLVVYFFGGQGGGKQANIDRWAGQFEQPDGRASLDVMQTSMRSVHGMHVDEVDLSGTYVAETSPGSGERVRKEAWRMLASIVEGAQGPHYIKLVGPAATVAHWEASYRRFVSDLQ
jgi:hypothetical protein